MVREYSPTDTNGQVVTQTQSAHALTSSSSQLKLSQPGDGVANG